MRCASLRLDPAGEAVLTAAIHALAAPQPDPQTGQDDERSPGQRRADALVSLATMATRPHPGTPGTGAKARILLTMDLEDLRTQVARHYGTGLADLVHGGSDHDDHDEGGTDHDARPDCLDPGRAVDAGHGGIHADADMPTPAEGDPPSRGAGSVFDRTSPTNAQRPADATRHAAGDARVPTAGDARMPAAGSPPQRGQPSKHPTQDAAAHPTGDAAEGQIGERGYGLTGFGQVLSPTEVRMLACDAHIIPIVLGGQGHPLDVGRAARLATPAQLAALHVRDNGCSFPGCTMPPGWCDAHHVIHWIEHGPTDLNNLTLLCRHHHTLVHRHHHTATITATGATWRRRDGTPIGNSPRGGPPATHAQLTS